VPLSEHCRLIISLYYDCKSELTRAACSQRFLGFLLTTALASHVEDRPKLLLVILARWQHYGLLEETVDAVEHVLAAVGYVRNLMESLR